MLVGHEARRDDRPPGCQSRWAQALFVPGALAITVLVLEVVCRLLRVDFDFKARAFARVPIFYRQPVVPVGPGFLRRPGPARWTGRVIATWLRLMGAADDGYGAEPAVTITYDRLGFRNPEDLHDWGVVVVGDSFTELGFLPYQELFTTRLGRHLRTGVKNLGVSYTGTFTQTFYLREYGRGPHTTDAVVVFFEGNDLTDLVDEHRRMERAREGKGPAEGRSLIENLKPQSSFVIATYRFLNYLRAPRRPPPQLVNAYFTTERDRAPVTLSYRPVAVRELSEPEKTLAAEAIRGWGTTARDLGLRPWLAFMPCKERVLDGHLVGLGGEPLPPFASDIPAFIAALAAENGIRFVDITPRLRALADARRLPFNGVWDSHLNRLGSRTVARSLTEALVVARGRERVPVSTSVAKSLSRRRVTTRRSAGAAPGRAAAGSAPSAPHTSRTPRSSS